MGMLGGIRILDFSHVYFGPYTTMILADMGAEVLKVEPPWGEIARLYPPLYGGMSSVFLYLDRNKKGLALNLKDPRALEIVKELAKKSDVIVENFKRGTMEKLGLGYEDVKKVNPKIIYASLSGFGLDGPYRDRPSFAPIAGSFSGWYRLSGDNIDPNGPPVIPAEWHGDLDPGLYAAIAILGAIIHRERKGEGQLIDVSQLDVMIAQNGVSITRYTLSGELPWQGRGKRLGPSTFGMFKAKDKYVYVAADPNMHERLKKAIGVEDLGEGPEVLKNWVEQHTSQEVVDAMVEASIPVAPILQIDEAINDPQVVARGVMVEIEHKTAGKIKEPQHPVKYSVTPATVRMAAPVLGEHNDEVLRELLGYTQAQCDQLRQEGVIV